MSPPSLRYGATSGTGLRGIQPAELDQFWPVAAPLLARGQAWRGVSLDAAGAAPLDRGEPALSLAHLAGRGIAVITGIDDYPAAKLLQILWVCGRLPENWRAIVASLERWGAERGCTEVETGGRFGWARKLAEEGYEAVPWVTLRKEL